MTKKLTIEIWYTDTDPDEQHILKEELEWVIDEISKSNQSGYNEYPDPMTGTPEIVTQFKIEKE